MRRLLRGMVVAAALLAAGCSSIQRTPPLQVWPDMRLQERFEAQGSTGLFADSRASRPRPLGVVARGRPYEQDVFNTGLLENGMYVGKSPVAVTEAVLVEGERRFNIYCSPCHDRTGMGKGMVPTRWPAWQPANLTEARVVELADGDIFNVMTYGRRTMPPYGAQNRPEERWAILAYVRLLQRATRGTMSDVPAEARGSIADYSGPPETPPAGTPSAGGAAKQ